MRSDPQSAYIIHVRPYKDSSAIWECLSLQHGLVSLVARGAKRPRSRLNMYMRPFLLLQLTWIGRGELKTLTQVEAEQISSVLMGEKLLLGLYLNELLMRLLQHYDPHPQLFYDYQSALHGLAAVDGGMAQQSVLRQFELKLLVALGYGVNLHEPILPDLLYSYDPLCGIYDISDREQTPDMLTVSGGSLIALQRGEFSSERELLEAKKLMRFILKFHLGAKPLQSRKLFSSHVRESFLETNI